MNLTGGTPQALALIEKLKLSGNLIDVYDYQRLKGLNDYPCVTVEVMDDLDKKYGTNYHHHLLAIFVDENVSGEDLVSIYPEFAEKFNQETIQPTLIFINLATRQIFTCTRVHNGNISTSFLPHPSGISDINSTERFLFVDKDLAERTKLFEGMDYASVVTHLTAALENIAYADYNLVYREIDSGHVQTMLAKGADENGLFYKDSLDDDDEGISEEELNEVIQEIDDLQYSLSEGISSIADFFPARSISYENFARDD